MDTPARSSHDALAPLSHEASTFAARLGEDSDCGECGDGITGPKESCEPAENCPTSDSCRALSACVLGVLRGNPETCSSTCELVFIDACKDGDGCCPSSCSPESDHDCSPDCGDAVVDPEAGEICEPSSPSSPCPASCDDGIACTTDVASGSAQNCNLSCSNLEIVAPVNDDGCCPSGASALNDSDCVPQCGNLVTEPGETCDPCPGASECSDQNACTADQLSGSGCNAQCTHTPITQPSGGDGCCPSGQNANSDSDCAAVCGNGATEPGEACDGGAMCRDCELSPFHNSLVHRYTFDGTGTTVSDSVGTANGTAVMCSVSSGLIDLTSTVSGNYVKFPSGILSRLSEVTFEVWLKWDGGAGRQRIFDFGYSTGTVGSSFFMLEPANGNGKLASYVNFTSATSDSANDWSVVHSAALSQSGVQHVAVTFSGTRLSLYLNGSRLTYTDDSAKSLSVIDDRNNMLGRSQFSADPELDATIHEFRIYSKALTPTEIQASYSAGQNP